jgi:uncharacterized protein YbaR (Trm112 family)
VVTETVTAPDPRLLELCVCPACTGALVSQAGLRCSECGRSFDVVEGIPILLDPAAGDTKRHAYRESYERLARDDLDEPLESDRAMKHEALRRFIGDVRGQRMLDIGASNALFLETVDADLKVAVDIALPYLQAIPAETNVLRVCADAEALPFARGAFDVIVVSDVLEHVLEPQRVVQRIFAIAGPKTRVIVHVPWEEDLRPYESAPYEFTHLRTFDAYTFARLWFGFVVKRERGTHPSLEQPLVFQLRRLLPLPLYNRLVRAYFTSDDGRQREYERRSRWIAELPKRERMLLLFYRPKFKMFELRPKTGFRARARATAESLVRRVV